MFCQLKLKTYTVIEIEEGERIIVQNFKQTNRKTFDVFLQVFVPKKQKHSQQVFLFCLY